MCERNFLAENVHASISFRQLDQPYHGKYLYKCLITLNLKKFNSLKNSTTSRLQQHVLLSYSSRPYQLAYDSANVESQLDIAIISFYNMSGNWLTQWGTSGGVPNEPKLDVAKDNTSLVHETQDVISSQPDQLSKPNGVSNSLVSPDHLQETKSGMDDRNEEVRARADLLPQRKAKIAKVTHKTSTSSLASISAGNWLSWAPRTRVVEKDGDHIKLKNGNTGVSELTENGAARGLADGADSGDHEGQDNRNDGNDKGNGGIGNGGGIGGNGTGGGNDGESGNGNDDEDDDYLPENNGDEIDDHVSSSKYRKKLWGFWNSEEPKDRKEKPVEKIHLTTNTILRTTPSLISKDETKNGNDFRNGRDDSPTKTETEISESDNGDDDAVLYKPHDSTSQFNKINTHKNENLRENVIVPDWNTCLHNQKLESAHTTSQAVGSLESIRNQPFDIKNWRSYLSHLSSRFGIGSGSHLSDQPEAQPAETAVEKEFNSIYERKYRLYGRSLAKLPYFKHACFPNYSLFYTKHDVSELGDKTQLEEDAQDENSITITNDAMGNLLINHRNHNPSSASVTQSDIVNKKTGPLVKIKKILIIGVHGFFPTRMIRPLIGAPKGTSLKFANEAEKAVIRYCVENDLIDSRETHNVSIQKIALEKEGKIFDRVDFFLEIMTKWADELNEADFIFIAAHSQGCVVSIILFAKLIQMGILKDPLQKRIGLLGMAGVNNGPFYSMDKSFFMKAYSAIEHDSLLELFELTKFDSAQSVAYKESMQIIINANVKICFIGSINDQLVPLYSALASHIFHPNIYRACYIDHSSRTPEFIERLVSVCCQLQNLGYFDNNVIKELSAVLAGPFTGGGHSKIYNDGKVYDLGLKFALDTDDLVIPPVPQTQGVAVQIPNSKYDEVVRVPPTNQIYIKEFNIGKIGTNPFVLPWCLRGLIFNIEKNWPEVVPHIMIDQKSPTYKSGTQEIDGLYELFDKWKPETKLLKDLKFRLNGIRASKL